MAFRPVILAMLVAAPVAATAQSVTFGGAHAGLSYWNNTTLDGSQAAIEGSATLAFGQFGLTVGGSAYNIDVAGSDDSNLIFAAASYDFRQGSKLALFASREETSGLTYEGVGVIGTFDPGLLNADFELAHHEGDNGFDVDIVAASVAYKFANNISARSSFTYADIEFGSTGVSDLTVWTAGAGYEFRPGVNLYLDLGTADGDVFVLQHFVRVGITYDIGEGLRRTPTSVIDGSEFFDF